MPRIWPRLTRDESGNAIIEFAFVAPIFAVMLVGILDASLNLYASSVLDGTMQKAGRDFTLEDARSRQEDMESFIISQVSTVAPNAVVTFERKSYFDFADVGVAEHFDDTNGDGICNNNELFEDANDNGQWDADQGQDSFGGARDAVLFTATATYPRLLPMAGLIGLDDTVVLESNTVLRNQPFDNQDRSYPTGNCE